MRRTTRVLAESRMLAKSGISPIAQNKNEIVKYVETAKTSQINGLRNCGHTPMLLGYGKSQYAATHGRPVWIKGNKPACMTAKMVMASAKRLMEVRHVCLKSNRMAEISVPAWPIPIHHTKLTIANPHPTGMLLHPIPVPLAKR